MKSKGLNFIHINTRSLLPKLEELRIIAAETRVAVIGVTETWLDYSVANAEVEIPGYHFLRKDRNREGGGVGLYIRSDLTFNHRTDLDSDIETVWCDLLLPKTKPIVIGVCYRAPRQTEFFDKLE